jgi:hypothetical protein
VFTTSGTSSEISTSTTLVRTGWALSLGFLVIGSDWTWASWFVFLDSISGTNGTFFISITFSTFIVTSWTFALSRFVETGLTRTLVTVEVSVTTTLSTGISRRTINTLVRTWDTLWVNTIIIETNWAGTFWEIDSISRTSKTSMFFFVTINTSVRT